jgi:hypothetical protein
MEVERRNSVTPKVKKIIKNPAAPIKRWWNATGVAEELAEFLVPGWILA